MYTEAYHVACCESEEILFFFDFSKPHLKVNSSLSKYDDTNFTGHRLHDKYLAVILLYKILDPPLQNYYDCVRRVDTFAAELTTK